MLPRISPRYEILRQLGAGGMGVVYEVRDRERGSRVALKTLARMEASALVRFKQEFRSLVDLAHPNLVRLYELQEENGTWFFTMELVEGVDLVRYQRGPTVRADTGIGPGASGFSGSSMESSPTLQALVTPSSEVWRSLGSAPSSLDGVDPSGRELPDSGNGRVAVPGHSVRYRRARLVSCLRQLARALLAVHESGKVHRDIKPSNVLVTPEERVVLLDFGLVVGMDRESAERLTGAGFAGTVAYMAPEAATDSALGPAADWYSVGVVLYEILTGRLPFDGAPLEVILKKQKEMPRSPLEHNPRCDGDLADLAMRLLSRDPDERPNGSEVLARLGETAVSVPSLRSGSQTIEYSETFVGRRRELERFETLWKETLEGRSATLLVTGPSGIGKTALVGRFRQVVRQAGGSAFVFSGKCYERETVPFKAFDSVVDRMTSVLLRLERRGRPVVLPRDIGYLLSMFPVLGRLTLPSHDAPWNGQDRIQNPKESRNRAFQAFFDLLRTMAARRPVLIAIDDLQWIDSDSIELLDRLVRAFCNGQGPEYRVLLLLTRRPPSGDSARKERLDRLVEEGGVEELSLGTLSDTEARNLAEVLLETAGLPDAGLSHQIAEESQGNPFFVGEMVRSFRDRPDVGREMAVTSRLLSLDGVILERIADLDELGRRVLETLAVAGEAISHALLAKAADLPMSHQVWWDEMSLLRARRLIRCDGFRASDGIEVYHDRIRESILASLDEDAKRGIHECLARALEDEPHVSVHMLARHWLAAGDQEQAKEYVLAAARKAMVTFAFDMAAALYGKALDLESEKSDKVALFLARGEALAAGGKVAQAAEAYSRAAEIADDVTVRLDARYKAADQMLQGGYLDRGLDEIRGVLAEVGYSMPSPGRAALTWTGYERARLRLRGFSYEVRDHEMISEEDRRRMNVLWSLSAGLSVGEPILSTLFQTRLMRLALDLGDEGMIAAGLAMEASLLASMGPRHFSRAERMVARAEALARKVGDERILGRAYLSRSLLGFFEGDWKTCLDWGDKTIAHLLEHCQGMAWELAMARSFVGFALMMRGDMNELRKRAWSLLEDARRSGNRFLVANVTTMPAAWLAEDRSEELAEELDHVLDTWPENRYLMHHWYRLYSRGEVLLYQGRPQDGWALFCEEEGRLRKSFVSRASVIALQIARLRGRLAVATAAGDGSGTNRVLLKAAGRAVKALRRQRLSYGDAWADLVEAALVWNSGQGREATRRALRRAQGSLSACDMALDAKAAAWRLAESSGDEEALARLREEMAAMGVVRPERMVAVMAPGFLFG